MTTENHVHCTCSDAHETFTAACLTADDNTLYRLADLFKVFGDPTRIRILHTLTQSEMCVQDIADTLSMTQSAISHQLRILKQSALVKFRRDGKTIYYSLADDHVATIMKQGLEHVCE